jgi:PTH2 family peptidyl-tRNA hydrolase
MYRIKVLYRKNLKMSPGKLAAQTGHAVLGLQPIVDTSIIVLEASDKKFFEKVKALKTDGEEHHVVRDAGRTEVEPGTETCVAFLEYK